ncbi:hypothetical protein BX666DRAFT_464768 [Dichotomocladium elegans]|nr:hypothetical protein BX666DRAFT_464768 [Dichotomocladium elegans]
MYVIMQLCTIAFRIFSLTSLSSSTSFPAWQAIRLRYRYSSVEGKKLLTNRKYNPAPALDPAGMALPLWHPTVRVLRVMVSIVAHRSTHRHLWNRISTTVPSCFVAYHSLFRMAIVQLLRTPTRKHTTQFQRTTLISYTLLQPISIADRTMSPMVRWKIEMMPSKPECMVHRGHCNPMQAFHCSLLSAGNEKKKVLVQCSTVPG